MAYGPPNGVRPSNAIRLWPHWRNSKIKFSTGSWHLKVLNMVGAVKNTEAHL